MRVAKSIEGTTASHNPCHRVALRLLPPGKGKGCMRGAVMEDVAKCRACLVTLARERASARPGEPLHNYEAVLASVAIATHELGLHFSSNKVRHAHGCCAGYG
jgi:hypothetical protein